MYSPTPLKTKAVPISGEGGPVFFRDTPPILSGQPQMHMHEATRTELSSLCYMYVWLICTYIHTLYMSTLITKEEIITLRETGGMWLELNWERRCK